MLVVVVPALGSWLDSNVRYTRTRMLEAALIIALIIVVTAAVTAAIAETFRYYHCPECRKYWALRKTGKTKGGPPRRKKEEWSCRFCGLTVWRDERLLGA